jgi:hypothetical protein
VLFRSRGLVAQAAGEKDYYPHGFNVFIIRGPRERTSGPYIVVGTERTADETRNDMGFDEAVLRGPKVYSARYLFTSEHELQKNPAVRVWDKDGTRGFGFLHPTRKPEESFWDSDFEAEPRAFAGKIISYDFLEGNEEKGIKPFQPGDNTLVRYVAVTHSKARIFEPVITFREDDGTFDPAGRQLITSVSCFEKGGVITALPILWLANDIKRNGQIAAGYVVRPENEEVNFYFKPVLVLDGNKYVGSYVPKAEIIANGKIILARAIE